MGLLFAALVQIDDIIENIKPPADTGVNGYLLMACLLMVAIVLLFAWRINSLFMGALNTFNETVRTQSDNHKKEADEHDKRLDDIKAHQSNTDILIAGVGTKIGGHDQWAQLAVTDIKSSVNDGFEKVMQRLAEMSDAADKRYAETIKQLADNHTEFKANLLKVAVDISSKVATANLPAVEPAQDPAIAEREAIGELVASINATVPEPPANDGETQADVVPLSAGDGV